MSKIDILATVATKVPALSKAALKVNKYSPEILFGAGVVGVVVGTVLACKATLKVDDILSGAKQDLENVKAVLESDGDIEYDEEDATKDKAIVLTKTAVELGKAYLPAVTTIGLGIACFVGSHNIQHSRVAALGAAYKLAEKGFRDYRGKIVEELGAEKEKDIFYNAKEETLKWTEATSNGKEKEVTKKVKAVEDLPIGTYWFSQETSRQWSSSRDYNIDFLKAQQNMLNDRLHLKGHLFLNEVLDALDLPRCAQGQLIGWLKDNPEGEQYVDFGLDETFYNAQFGHDYVNGRENSYLLKFNVDCGSIYDQI